MEKRKTKKDIVKMLLRNNELDENDEEILAFVEDIELYGKKNRKAYQNNFTEIPFKKRYEEILKQFIADYKSEV